MSDYREMLASYQRGVMPNGLAARHPLIEGLVAEVERLRAAAQRAARVLSKDPRFEAEADDLYAALEGSSDESAPTP